MKTKQFSSINYSQLKTKPLKLFEKYNQSILFLPMQFDEADGLFYSDAIQIGTPPQKFQKILFDPITVSQTWVVSTQCKEKSDKCGAYHLQHGSFFDASLSNTFISACVPFLVSRKTYGEIGFDTMQLLQIESQPISIPKVKLGLAIAESSSNADLLISLRFGTKESAPTFMDVLTNQIPSIYPSFAMFLPPLDYQYHSIVFGSQKSYPPWVTSLLNTSTTKFIPLNSIALNNNISWVVDLKSVSLSSIGILDDCKGPGGMLGDNACHVQMDSALPFALAGPPSVMRKIGQSIPIDSTCSQYETFPILQIAIQNQMYSIHKEMYVKKLPNGSCKLLMAAFSQDVDELYGRRYILGTPFLKSYFIAYDLFQSQISITNYL